MSRKYCDELKQKLIKNLNGLSKKYKISKKDRIEFMNSINIQMPLRKKTVLKYDERCKARKQDGTQCSRRHKANESFCGKHIHNQKYGIFELSSPKTVMSRQVKHKSKNQTSKKSKKLEKNSDILTLKSVQIKDKYYYIDKNNILYNPEPVNGLYEIIGKLTDNIKNDIYYATCVI